jgi:hypothetical protein
VEPNPIPSTPSLDLKLVKITKIRNRLGYQLKDRLGEPERGSEWGSIKILLEGDGNSNKTNTTSKTRLRLNYLLMVDYRIKVHLDLQADKSSVVVKGPFFP